MRLKKHESPRTGTQRNSKGKLASAPTAGNGLQIGSRVQWGTSLATWAITAIDGDTATIRQCSGWAMAVPFEAKLSKLLAVG